MNKDAQAIARNLQRQVNTITRNKAPRAATMAAIIIQGEAALLTPVDTSALINSQFRRIETNNDGSQAFIGYTALYALAVHDRSGSGKGQPRDPNDPSRGNMWDPAAEPGFLMKGAERAKPRVDAVVAKELKL